MSALARRVQVPRCWIERRIWNGTIAVTRDAAAKRYLFPRAIQFCRSRLDVSGGGVT